MLDPFGRSSLPADFGREHRIRMVGEAFSSWLRGEQPSDEARLFVAGAAVAWLNGRGDLVGDYWRIRGRQGSNATPAVVWSSLREARQDDEDDEHCEHSNPESSSS